MYIYNYNINYLIVSTPTDLVDGEIFKSARSSSILMIASFVSNNVEKRFNSLLKFSKMDHSEEKVSLSEFLSLLRSSQKKDFKQKLCTKIISPDKSNNCCGE